MKLGFRLLNELYRLQTTIANINFLNNVNPLRNKLPLIDKLLGYQNKIQQNTKARKQR